ncbi:MAG: hypothetical protein PHV11_05915, partial [Candidatus Bipolaricaulis sp.]|nr:hypothetical protein [Candidatus Bipolaricaulis sp.]
MRDVPSAPAHPGRQVPFSETGAGIASDVANKADARRKSTTRLAGPHGDELCSRNPTHHTPSFRRACKEVLRGRCGLRVGHHPEPTPMGVIHITYRKPRTPQRPNPAHMADVEGTSAPR